MEKLQCELCGGALAMAEDGESAVCESCGMRFKKETIKKMVMELSGPVQVEGIQNASSAAQRAETFLRMGETEKAKAAFHQLADDYPADYRGWWGLTRLTDWNDYFYTQGTGEAQPPLVYQRAVDFSEGAAKAEIQRYYAQQVETVKNQTDIKLNNERTDRRTQEACAMADKAYGAYHAQAQALYKAEDALAEKIANAKAQLAGTKQDVAQEAKSVGTARVLVVCSAVFTVVCYNIQLYFLVILGAVATFFSFLASFSKKGQIPKLQQALSLLEKEAAEQNFAGKIASIPFPDGSDSTDPAAFLKQFESLYQRDTENRHKQLGQLQKQYDILLKKETVGKDIARFCNGKPFKQVCEALQIQHLYANLETQSPDFVKLGKKAGNYRFSRFVKIYENMVYYEVEVLERKKGKEKWKSIGIVCGRCEVLVDEGFRALFPIKQ